MLVMQRWEKRQRRTLLLNSTILPMISLSIRGKMESPMNSMSLLVSGSTNTCRWRSEKSFKVSGRHREARRCPWLLLRRRHTPE